MMMLMMCCKHNNCVTTGEYYSHVVLSQDHFYCANTIILKLYNQTKRLRDDTNYHWANVTRNWFRYATTN